MINKIHHVGITVHDYRRSLDFYCNVLGMTQMFDLKIEGNSAAAASFESDDHALQVAMLAVPADLGGGMLEVFHFDRPEQEPAPEKRMAWQPGYTHICLTTDDLHAAYQTLKEKGVNFVSPPVEFTGEGVTAVVAPQSGPGAGRSVIAYFRDPDGALIELAQFS